MDVIQELLNINFSVFIFQFFVILFGIKAIISIIEWVLDKLGLETKGMRKRREQRELLKQTSDNLIALQNQQTEDRKISTQHDKMIKSDLSKLSDTVDGIVVTLAEMQKKDNETELKRLKDSLVRYYNKYKAIGEWSKLEKDAFWDLFDEYETRGGDGYIHSIVEPVMRGLREID